MLSPKCTIADAGPDIYLCVVWRGGELGLQSFIILLGVGCLSLVTLATVGLGSSSLSVRTCSRTETTVLDTATPGRQRCVPSPLGPSSLLETSSVSDAI